MISSNFMYSTFSPSNSITWLNQAHKIRIDEFTKFELMNFFQASLDSGNRSFDLSVIIKTSHNEFIWFDLNKSELTKYNQEYNIRLTTKLPC